MRSCPGEWEYLAFQLLTGFLVFRKVLPDLGTVKFLKVFGGYYESFTFCKDHFLAFRLCLGLN
jgi:hypothetical protein